MRDLTPEDREQRAALGRWLAETVFRPRIAETDAEAAARLLLLTTPVEVEREEP